MKIYFPAIVVLLFLSIPNLFFAQDKNSNSWEHGVRVGVNYHWQIEGDFTFDSDIGFLAGYFASKPINKYLKIQADLQYIQQGYKINETIFTNATKIKINRNYINGNLTANLTFLKSIEIRVGGFLGALVDANQMNLINDKYEEQDLNNQTSFDAGALLGVSTRFKKLGISLEHYVGLVNTDSDVIGDFKFLNRGLALILSYSF